MDSPTQLSLDLIYEIMTRVSLDTLLRHCRQVNKYCRSLTYNSTFKRIHCKRTQSFAGYFIQSLYRKTYATSFVSIIPSSSLSLNFMPTNVKIEASSSQAQGLLCCTTQEPIPRYYVCKPATRELTKLPNPKTRYFTEKMGMVVMQSDPLYYKIIRFSFRSCNPGFRCEIFDSEKWVWKKLEDVKLPHSFLLDHGPGVLINGSFHWLTFDGPKAIFAFDVNYEKWKSISLPQSEALMNEDFRIGKQLVECEGHVAVMYTDNAWMEVWVMEEYWNESWKKRYRVSLEPLNRVEPLNYVLALDTVDMALVNCCDKMVWYNCEREAPMEVVNVRHQTTQTVHGFCSDFLPCNLGPRTLV